MVIRDISKALEDSPELLIFTPVVGYTYLYIEVPSLSFMASLVPGSYVTLTGVSLLISSFIFNYSLASTDNAGRRATIFVGVLFLIHTGLVIDINEKILYALSESKDVYGVAIVLLSGTYFSWILTRKIIRKYIGEFED
jgi:hypothetical protein